MDRRDFLGTVAGGLLATPLAAFAQPGQCGRGALSPRSARSRPRAQDRAPRATVASSDEVRASLRALKPGAADAYLQAGDSTIVSQTDVIIDVARTKKLPTMFSDETSVARGGLASYGLNYRTASRHAATYVRRVLAGADPSDLPVEQMDEPYIVINLQTARGLGLTIPPPLLQRADQVIE